MLFGVRCAVFPTFLTFLLDTSVSQLRQMEMTLGVTNGDKKHDTKAVLEAERKLKAYMENTLALQLQ